MARNGTINGQASVDDGTIFEHEYYMRQALKVAQIALEIGEVPVGCVVVLPTSAIQHHFKDTEPTATALPRDSLLPRDFPSVIVSHGANQVNATRDATRHAELVAIDRMLTGGQSSDQLRLPTSVYFAKSTSQQPHEQDLKDKLYLDHEKWVNVPDDIHHWKNTYGWNSGRRYTVSDLTKCRFYVTCEPCIMCADALSKLQVASVYFGCRNDKFGGCGSILNLHCEQEFHKGYPIQEGILAAEAIQLLRAFYNRENFHAPEEKRKRKENCPVEKNESNAVEK